MSARSQGERSGVVRLPRLLSLAGLLPQGPLKNALLRRAGADVHPSARVAPCLLVGVRELHLAERSSIGVGTVVRDLERLDLAEGALLGQFNWISASRMLVDAGGAGELRLARQAAITSRHYIDASGGVRIGNHSTVAGVRSTFMTHGIDWRDNTQRTKGIAIGRYCLIGSNCSITPGTALGDESVVGMGASLAGVLPGGALILSSRAVSVRGSLQGRFFQRQKGWTGTPGQPEQRSIDPREGSP